ncbi:TetR/AcrR family transcriptional regulator [uncultured Clostridium sp.]|uniref:TetR/AcrR family transcriptional regulator n=1 Tax=uncultured Clostridium sp. TaxID=59620 RepID=UPI00261565BB|nr:TetR/AcrR family transcriptional regulator [uncultured Clostridium sp.]
MKREEKSRLTKEKLFKVAMDLVDKKGYENITVSEICKEAGVAKGTFYVHFESKDDIIKANYYEDMSKYIFKKLDIYVLEKYRKFDLENNNIQIKEKIKFFVKLENEYIEKMGYKLTSRAFITNLTDSINDRKSNFDNRAYSEPLKFLIEQGIDSGEFKKGRTKGEVFLIIDSFTRGLAFQWCLTKGDIRVLESGLIAFYEIIENL